MVADSNAEAEAREAAAKAAPLLAAIGATVPEGVRPLERRRPMGSDPSAGPAQICRPVSCGGAAAPPPARPRGRAVRDGADRDGRAAGPRAAPRAARREPAARCTGARCRTSSPRGRRRGRRAGARPPPHRRHADGEAELTVTASRRRRRDAPPRGLPGGLGPHKFRDRRLLESHEADDPATMPLLLDADGLVLETSRASVVVRAPDGTLHTPPRDGRILPGVTAALAGAAERRLTLADLRAAHAVFVASALRGLQRAPCPGASRRAARARARAPCPAGRPASPPAPPPGRPPAR